MSIFGLLLFFLLGLTLPLPLGVPPRLEDPALLRAVPREALAVVQWFGLAAPAAAGTNAAERFAAHPEVRHMFAEIDRAVMQWCTKQEEQARGAPVGPLEAAGLLRVALTSPGIAFLAGFDPAAAPASLRAGIVLRPVGSGEDARAAPRLFEMLKVAQARIERGAGADQPAADQPIGSATARVLALPAGLPRVVFGCRGEHVFVAVGEGTAEALVQALESGGGLGADPEFAAQHAQVRVERPVLRVHANVAALLRIAAVAGAAGEAELERLGLDGVRHLLLEHGLDGDGARARAFLTVEGQPRGVLLALAGQPLAPADLAPIPADASAAMAMRLEPAALLDVLQALVASGPVPMLFGLGEPTQDPPAEDDPIAAARADLLAGLGNVVTAWNAPGQGGFVFTGATVAIRVRDRAAAERAHERILASLRKQLPARADAPLPADPGEGPPRQTTLEQTAFGPHAIHYLNPRGYEPFAPAWCFAGDHVLVSLNLPVLKAALRHVEAREPDLSSVPALARAPAGAALFVQDMRGDFPFACAMGAIGATYLCRSLQEDGFDLTIDALPSAAAFRDVLGHEVLGLRRVEGGFALERRGRLPSLLGVLPLFPMLFAVRSF